MTRRWTAIGDEWAVLDGDRVVATCRDFADVVRLCPVAEAKPAPEAGGIVHPNWKIIDGTREAAEAKRPTHVRITKSESPSRFKDGDVLRVAKWIDEVPAVDVDGYDVAGYVLYDSKWEPCPPPAPVAPVDPVREAERAVVEAAEGYYDNGRVDAGAFADAIRALRAARKASSATETGGSK